MYLLYLMILNCLTSLGSNNLNTNKACLFGSSEFCTQAEISSLDAEEFLLKWCHQKETVTFSLTAPTAGWVAIGFTNDKQIVDTNLIQGCVKDDKVVIEDQYITGFGKHPPMESLGVPSRISQLKGEQLDGSTTILFQILKQKEDSYHFDLSAGKEINVWLAYSVSDDFNHHSRKRILRSIKL